MEKNKKLLALLLLLVVCLFCSTTTTSSQQSSGELFEKALYAEEVEGELEKALEIYQTIIREYPDNRPIAAKAQFHIGLCYEKLGLEQAQKAYREVVNNYPDQHDEVTKAKERLNRLLALKEISAKPNFRKIRIPTKPRNGVLSPDGEKLAFTSMGSVWIVPVQGKVQPDLAGEPYSITKPMEASNFSNTIAWSGNGKWIAFSAVDNKKDAIYIISATGGEPKKIPVEIYRSGGGIVYDHRLSLSPDGKLLAFSSSDIHTETVNREKEEPFSIYTISVDGGIITHLTEDNTQQPAFSPDGKMIAFVKRYQSTNGKNLSEGWVIPSTGGTPIRVTDSSKHVIGPVWSPDGKMIAFTWRKEPASSEINEILIVPVSENGKPLNSSKVFELPQQTDLISAGWSQNNKIGYHLENPRYQAIYTIPFSGGKATQVTPEGYGNNPCWTLDGKRLFFRWDTGIIAYVPAGGGEVSIVPIQSDEKIFMALPGGGNHISPDGTSIVFTGGKKDLKGKYGYNIMIMTMPVEGGVPNLITKNPIHEDRFPCWSPDGKHIAFIRYHEKSKGIFSIDIFVISSAGGEAKQITSENENVDWSSIKFTPDGSYIAYFSNDNSIKMIPVQGGEPKEIVKVKTLNHHNEIIMLKDGKHMAYTSDWKIWMVSLDGGEPRQIETGLNDWLHSQIAQSPDGTKLAFTAFTGGDSDLWLMEDFLPSTETEK